MKKHWLYKLQTRAVVPLLAMMPLTGVLTEKHGLRHLKRHNVALKVSDKVSNSPRMTTITLRRQVLDHTGRPAARPANYSGEETILSADQ
jgi:hypothetical protein